MMAETIIRKKESLPLDWKDKVLAVLIECRLYVPGQPMQIFINLHEKGIGDVERKERFK